MRLLFAAVLLLAATGAGATAWVGSDKGGADITLANGDTLSGTFTNVGKLSLPAGATAYVVPNVNFALYATTVAIYGTLDGVGRGQPGGSGGGAGSGGTQGFSPTGNGFGGGGAAALGGGGGAGLGNAGAGAGASGGSPGTGYSVTITSPVSADDAAQGSGGGGGGGGSSASNGSGGSGAAGGASVYIEASSMTVTGAIRVNGAPAAAVTDGASSGTHPGGGGGGGGGSIVLRITGQLQLSHGAQLAADGGKGADVQTLFAGALEPGGGGGGGRIRIFASLPSYDTVAVSTSAGSAGGKPTGFSGSLDTTNPAGSGSVGASTFGVVAQAPSGFSVQSANIASISYSWTAPGSFGDAGSAGSYRIFPATDTAPYGNPDATSATTGVTISGLTPNTTYYRFATSFTDWGDSAPSNSISTHTLADVPGAASTPFSSMADTSLKAAWTSGTNGNPSYTTYEVDRSTDPAFGLAVSTSYVVATSSSPSGLLPNTSYYFRVRAINLDNVPTAFATALTTATLATQPSSPALLHVYVTSVSFNWSQGANPADTKYEAQVSSDNFFSIAATSDTLAPSATFFALTPGKQYYLRVFAYNREGASTSFSTVVSTTLGDTSNTTPPTDPGTPQSSVRFSYDGSVTFSWSPASSAVGILGYNLIIGSTPGGNDIADVPPASLSAAQYTKTGMSSGQTVYARVRAYSNAGVYGGFSSVSAGVPVFIAAQASPFAKAINWPNPFNPSEGPTQIGIYVDSAADVKLRFFTLQGRLVHEQSYSFAAAGDQIVTWDGRNGSGARVAPGGYIVLVEKRYGGRSETQKLKIAVLY